jgi:predicted RNase H-like nuclease (RuvC/YqgF family)
MNEEARESFQRYEQLKQQIKELENEIVMLQPLVMAYMSEDEKVETESGSFVLQSRSVYEYSPYTQELEQKIKNLKKEEIADGTAKETKGEPYIVYKAKK